MLDIGINTITHLLTPVLIPAMNRSSKIVKPHPFLREGMLNKLFFWWVMPILKIGWKRSLELSDLFSHPKADEPDDLTNDLLKNWKQEVDDGKRRNKRPSITVAVIKTLAPYYGKYIWLVLLSEGIIKPLQPLLIGVIVNYLSNPTPNMATYGGLAMCGLLLSNAFCTLTLNHLFSKFQRIGNNMRTALSNMIYQKMLRLSKSSADGQEMGIVLNILANDLNRFEDLGWMSTYYLSSPICGTLGFIVCYSYIGVSTCAGFLLILLFLPFQSLMGRLFSRFRSANMRVSDKRVNLMGEILGAMKLIKVYCWEQPFIDAIRDIREDEISKLKKTVYLSGVNSSLFSTATKLFLFASLISYVLTNDDLTAEMVFVCMSVFNSIRLPLLSFLPEAVGITAEALVAFGRIDKFLVMDEKPVKDSSRDLSKESKGSIIYDECVAKWSKGTMYPSLNGISFNLKPGELLIVVGSVGAGKTCLLYSLLNEIHHVSGKCMVNGSLSYAPQDTWCIGDTVKNNILMGDQIDLIKYKQVINVCGLKRDIELFELQDEHFVGEKGYTLSGGQKARVSLARCVYKESDIYLLDDPLSAVDPKVANHIFNDCIRGYLNGKTVVLVTHQLQFLEKADKIAVLKDGKLTSFGKYNDLANNDPEFNFILKKLRKEEKRKTTNSKNRGMSLLVPKEDEVEEEKKVPAIDQDQLDLMELKREESKESGSVSLSVIWNYLRTGASVLFLLSLIIVSFVSQGIFFFNDVWLSAWTEVKSSNSSTPSIAHNAVFDNENYNIYLYGSIIITNFLVTFLRVFLISYMCLTCSINMHNMIFDRILKAKMEFFDSNPLGRILNRFTRDMSIMDTIVFRTVCGINFCALDIIGTIALSATVNSYLLIPAILLAVGSWPIRELYIRSARDINRLDSIARSPLFSHLTTTYDGLITVRAFQLENKFKEAYVSYLKDSISTRCCVFYTVRWFGTVMDFFANFYIMCIAIVLFSAPQGMIPASDAGLVLTTSLLLIGLFQHFMRISADFENQMTSAERIMEYGKLPQEAAFRVEGAAKNPNWLKEGKIHFNKVALRYNPESAPVLKNITFTINAGEKVGVVGRTGAGKSSLIFVLFRLVEPEGRITIDGVDIQSIGLHDLREKISIIPQDPSLFSGLVRRNLDPFGEYSDHKIWEALNQAHLGETIKNMGGLDSNVSEGGSNLSIGQRQLLCLGRSLLKQNRILVMDEATANVDQETDELIQKTIKLTFKDYTVLTVAHRLNTIIDMDKVLVMDSGEVVEFDHPHKLLQDEDGTFHSMVKQTGPEFEKMLHLLAEKSFYSKATNQYGD